MMKVTQPPTPDENNWSTELRRKTIPWIAFALALGAVPAQAEPPTARGPVGIDRSEQYIIRSEKIDADYRIDVMLPIGYSDTEDKYPVVYITDSNYLFYPAAATQLAQVTDEIPDLILVGIGYDVDHIPEIAQVRARDFSPSYDEVYQKENAMPADLRSGGADDFIAFIEDQVKPFIDASYRTNPDDETLIGYSFGGLFALHVLFTSNDSFDRYIIGSPYLDWDNGLIFDEEQTYADSHEDLARVVYLSAGSLEGWGTLPGLHTINEDLRGRDYPNLEIYLDILDDETHMTGINSFVMRGIRSVLTDWSP